MENYFKTYKSKEMKATKLIWILLVVVLIAACNNDDSFDYDGDFEDEFGEFEDDQSDQVGGDEEGSLTLYNVLGNEIDKEKDFSVSGNLVALQQDYGKHLEMWEFIKKLIPENERKRIVEFMVFYGGNDLAGYVQPINDNDLSKWRFGLAIELAENIEEIDFENFFTYVTIHELGHIVTLKETQVDVNVNQSECGTYFPGEGCAKRTSYINGIYDLGWTDIYRGEDDNEGLYDEYKDRFVTDYAATNPAEDIAEVFAFFVTKANRPTGNSIADQKINLLYEYPELVQLREDMRGNPTLRAMQPGSWKNNPLAQKFKIGKFCKHHHHSIEVEKSAVH